MRIVAWLLPVRQGGTRLAELRFVQVGLACEEGEHAAGWERECKRSLGRSGVADQAFSETARPQLCPGPEYCNPQGAARARGGRSDTAGARRRCDPAVHG